MVKSGVTVSAECIEDYNKLKFKREFDFLILRLTPDMKAIEVAHAPVKNSYLEVKEFQRSTIDACGESAPDVYKNFFEKLTEGGSCGYGLIELKWMKKDLGLQANMVMITWIPDTAKIKPKMMYSSSKEDLKKKIQGVQSHSYELSDLKDFEFKEMMERVSKGSWDPNAAVPES